MDQSKKWPSWICFIFWYGVPHHIIKQYVKGFGPIMYSFRVVAWALTLDFEIFRPFILILAVFFTFKIFFSKRHFSYIIVYIKSHNYVDYNNTGGEGGCTSPLNHLIFGSNYLTKPKDTKCQTYMGLMYWIYIFIFWNKTHGFLF